MLRFVLRKIVRVGAVLSGAVLITFLLMHAIPGNPWSNYSTSPSMLIMSNYDQPMLQNLEHHFGLDLPLWRQFTRYLLFDIEPDGRLTCGAVCGNLGPSIIHRGLTVQEVLFLPPEGRTFWESRVGYSLRLVLLGALFVVGLGIPLGMLSAGRPKSAISRGISIGLAALISIPNFVLGLLAIIVLATWLKVIRVIPDWQNPAAWIVPAIVLAAMPMASLARVTHASLMNTLHEEYVRTARAKGLTERRVMWVHVLRNVLAPVLTFLGPTLVEMFIGLFIVENLYGFPGFGKEYWLAVLQLDYPMILGLTVIYAGGIVLANLLIEILGAVLDPRLRAAEAGGMSE